LLIPKPCFRRLFYLASALCYLNTRARAVRAVRADIFLAEVRARRSHQPNQRAHRLAHLVRAAEEAPLLPEHQVLRQHAGAAAAPIPFELAADDAKAQLARKHLDTLGIAEPKLVQDILQSAKHVDALFAFIYELKTDKIKVTKNPGGLFLKMVGLR
jgi:hypothetical protein